MASHDRFGFEWARYKDVHPQYEEQFKNWIFPLTRKDFEGKAVLDAGCGMGRNSFWVLSWGAKRLQAFDYGQASVEAARENLKNFPHAKVSHESIYDIKYENEFDIVMSIGVIHHLKDPKLAIKNLIKALKPGGRLIVWVYGKDGYGRLITTFVDPVRKNITSRLPISFVHALSYLISAPLWVFVKIFKGPGKLFRQFSTFPFWHLHSIVFDHLLPEIANYWDADEVRGLVDKSSVSRVEVARPPHGWGWTLLVTK